MTDQPNPELVAEAKEKLKAILGRGDLGIAVVLEALKDIASDTIVDASLCEANDAKASAWMEIRRGLRICIVAARKGA